MVELAVQFKMANNTNKENEVSKGMLKKAPTTEIEFPSVDQDVASKIPLVAGQVEKWLRNPNHSNSLPKNLDKLYTAIKPFCVVRLLVLPVPWLITQLQEVQMFSLEEDIVIPLHKTYDEPKFLNPKNQTHLHQLQAYTRCCEWFSRNKSPPRTIQGLSRSLEQICTMVFEVEPHEIVKQLVTTGTIACTSDGRWTLLGIEQL